MRILVTGATSGLGRNAIDFLLDQNLPMRATGRNRQEGQKIQAQGIEFVAADLSKLTDDVAEELFRDIDTVWHCAALSSPWGKYDDFYAANVTATENLIHYAIQYGVKNFIHISTPSIYFDYKSHYNIEEDYLAQKFVNHYALTKMLAEQKIKAAAIAHPEMTFIMLRPRAIFGEHDRVLLPRLLTLLEGRKGTLTLPRAGEAIMDMTYSLNVVHAMYLATQLPDDQKRRISGNAYNITNQEPAQLKVVLTKLLQDGLGKSVKFKSVPYPILSGAAKLLSAWGHYRDKEPVITEYGIGALHYDMTLSNTAAQRDLGYFPKYSLSESIQRTAKWFNTHGKDYSI